MYNADFLALFSDSFFPEKISSIVEKGRKVQEKLSSVFSSITSIGPDPCAGYSTLLGPDILTCEMR